MCSDSVVTMISDQKHFDQLQHIMMLNRDKFVTGFGIRGQLSVPNDLAFFRDRPSKFGPATNNGGTDGHLSLRE